MARGHAEALMPLLKRVMDQAGRGFTAIDRVAVTTGPGSFTGLRVGLAAARGIALAADKPAVGLSTLSVFAAPHMATDDSFPVVAAIDARHGHVYLQVFSAGGRTFSTPRLASLSEAAAAAAETPAFIVGSAAQSVADALTDGAAPPVTVDTAACPRYRLGRADGRGRTGRAIAADTAISARRGRAAAIRGATAAPMMNFVARLLTRPEPKISEVVKNDAAAIAAVHAASFRHGWSEDEFRRMLADRNIVAHRTMIGRTLIGFILSRLIDDEAEILSVAIAPPWRGRGFSRPLLDLHLRRLAGLGARTVFLEVDKHNAPATRLYRQAGFYEVGQRQGYYDSGAAALVLRRDLG